MDGTFQATAGIQDSDVCRETIKVILRCIFKVIFQGSVSNPVPPLDQASNDDLGQLSER